jgi:hypothetical protein
MTSTTPSPLTWTLRLKSHKTTVVLHVNPLQTFSLIKTELLHALQDTSLKHPDTGEEIPLPDSPSDIQLGRPITLNDPHAGFTLGEWEYTNTASDMEIDEVKPVKNGKGAKRGKNDGGNINVKDCPKGAGLKDNAVLAFRFKGDGTEWEDEDDGDEGVDLSADDVRGRGKRSRKGDMWGVRIASFEDSYGEVNTGDVGLPGGKAFEG